MAQLPISSSNDGSNTATIEEIDGSHQLEVSHSGPTLQLRLEQPRDDRRVVFHDGVIDNEHMNRMKSKCCCIYRRPLAFGESSSEDDDECEHCFGHPEKRKKNKTAHNSCSIQRQTEQPSTSAEAQPHSLQLSPATVVVDVPAAEPDNIITAGKPSL